MPSRNSSYLEISFSIPFKGDKSVEVEEQVGWVTILHWKKKQLDIQVQYKKAVTQKLTSFSWVDSLKERLHGGSEQFMVIVL